MTKNANDLIKDAPQLNIHPTNCGSPFYGDCPKCQKREQLMVFNDWLYCPNCHFGETPSRYLDPSQKPCKVRSLFGWVETCCRWRAHHLQPLPGAFHCAIDDFYFGGFDDPNDAEGAMYRYLGIIDVGATRAQLRQHGVKLAKSDLSAKDEGIVLPVGPYPGWVNALFVITVDHRVGLIRPAGQKGSPGKIHIRARANASTAHFTSIWEYLTSSLVHLPFSVNITIDPVLGKSAPGFMEPTGDLQPDGDARYNSVINIFDSPLFDGQDFFGQWRLGKAPAPPGELGVDYDWRSPLSKPTRVAQHNQYTHGLFDLSMFQTKGGTLS